MEIESIKPAVVGVPAPHKGGRNFVFVKVVTDEGLHGWGECSLGSMHARTLERGFKEIERHVVGHDPFDIESLRGQLYRGNHFFHIPGWLHQQLLAGIEIACWDIIGKATDQPIYKLLGGAVQEELRAYTYMHYRAPDDGTAAEFADAAKSYVDEGFTAIKVDPIRPAVGPREVPKPELDFAEEVVETMRDAVGEAVDICVGTHGQLHTQEAIRLAKRLEPYDPLWLEEPVPPENVDAMSRVAEATTIPIATGERLPSKFHFGDLAKNDAASIFQINVCLTGILEAKKIAGIAETNYLQLAPWMYAGPIHGVASMHVGACSPDFLIQESIEDWNDSIHNTILAEPVEYEDGYIKVPDGPGLGVEIDESRLDEYPMNEPTSERIGPLTPRAQFR